MEFPKYDWAIKISPGVSDRCIEPPDPLLLNALRHTLKIGDPFALNHSDVVAELRNEPQPNGVLQALVGFSLRRRT